MPRYVALLRGVSPMNAKMADLRAAFEQAGFTNVRTVISSGNVVFDGRASTERALARRCEAAMSQHLARSFYTIVRSTMVLRELLESDPFAAYRLPRGARRLVTFLGEAPATKPGLTFPVRHAGAIILGTNGRELFTAYVPTARGAPFMALIENTFGTRVTTRTWETVEKCAHA
jgi:uncharacterized protein (DUF1697 family)